MRQHGHLKQGMKGQEFQTRDSEEYVFKIGLSFSFSLKSRLFAFCVIINTILEQLIVRFSLWAGQCCLLELLSELILVISMT